MNTCWGCHLNVIIRQSLPLKGLGPGSESLLHMNASGCYGLDLVAKASCGLKHNMIIIGALIVTAAIVWLHCVPVKSILISLHPEVTSLVLMATPKESCIPMSTQSKARRLKARYAGWLFSGERTGLSSQLPPILVRLLPLEYRNTLSLSKRHPQLQFVSLLLL